MGFSALQRAEIAEILEDGFRISRASGGFSALQRAEIAEILTASRKTTRSNTSFSALQRAEIAEMASASAGTGLPPSVSVLFNEPKLLKLRHHIRPARRKNVSVLFNEPKLLKWCAYTCISGLLLSFSALQRAEIAEIKVSPYTSDCPLSFSALQRAEIAEIIQNARSSSSIFRFSALQRAEIAEMARVARAGCGRVQVSVLFNEPKLLKLPGDTGYTVTQIVFQCSSTSRNC